MITTTTIDDTLFIDYREFARIAGYNPRSIYNILTTQQPRLLHRKADLPPFVRIDHKLVIRIRDLCAWLDARPEINRPAYAK